MSGINLRTVDLNLLRVFLSIWETRSLTVAADHLALTQPAVSHSLRKLRDLFDDPLFVRTPTGMQPTAAAIRLHKPIDQAIGMIHETLQLHAGFDAATAQRTFKISMSDMSEFYFLPPLLAHLQEHGPGIRFRIVQPPLSTLESSLRSGEVDLSIGFAPGLSKECDTSTMFNDKHVCMIRADHPLAHQDISKELLESLRYIFANSSATGHRMIEQWLSEIDIKRNIVLNLPHFTVAPEIVRKTDLAVILPHSIALRFNKHQDFRLLPLPFDLPAIDVSMHWHLRFNTDPGLMWLRALFMDMFSKPMLPDTQPLATA